MDVRERVARAWHSQSDHAKDGTPLGGSLCNCDRVAERIMPMLRDAWRFGYTAGMSDEEGRGYGHFTSTPNPYETEEDRHVDQ